MQENIRDYLTYVPWELQKEDWGNRVEERIEETRENIKS